MTKQDEVDKLVEKKVRVICSACMGDKYKKRNCDHCEGRGYHLVVTINHYGFPPDASQRRM